MKTDRYILNDDGKPIPEPDLIKWATWFGTANRIVCQETIAQNRISTIFLGLDHNWWSDGAPILWETMSFGAKLNQEQARCAGSKEQAEAMHEEMVKAVCEASGVLYDPDRQRVSDPGVCRRLAAVHRKLIQKLRNKSKKL